MRRFILLLGWLVWLSACHTGPGFLCTASNCARTAAACEHGSKSTRKPCIRTRSASCFDGHDDDNMVTTTGCYIDQATCESARKEAITINPAHIYFTPCETRY